MNHRNSAPNLDSQTEAACDPGYRPGTGMGSVVTGTIYALVDGVIGGAIFGWLYNLFAARKAE